MLGRVGPNWALVNCSCESCFVNDCNAGRWLKVKLRFGDGDVLLPIAEAEFGFDISHLTEHDADKAGLRVRLQENFAEGISRVGGAARAVSWRAAQKSVAILP